MVGRDGRAAATRGRRRALAVGAGLAVGAVALAACGGGSGGGGSQGSATKATLTFVNAQDPGTFDKVIAGFTKANPGIRIKQQVVPFDDLNTTVQSRLQGKDSGIDLYDVDEPRLASFASRGYLADLGDVAKSAQASIDPHALAATRYAGKQYALPRWTSTQLLFYNKALLKKAGVPAPSSDPDSPITWEQVVAEGKKAQSAGAKWGFTFDQVDRYYQLQPLAESLGGGSGLSGKGNLTPDITNAAWVKAMTWYGSTFRSGVSPRGIAPEQTGPLFGQGKTAFFAGGPWNATAFDEAKVDYGVAPYPLFQGGKPASSTGSWATGVSPFSKHQAAAKKFIAYMTTNPTGAWQANSNNIPVQKAAFAKYLAQTKAKGPVATQMAGIVQGELAHNAVSRPTSTGFVDFETVMNKAFADIRNGSDPAARLGSATKELTSVLKKYQG